MSLSVPPEAMLELFSKRFSTYNDIHEQRDNAIEEILEIFPNGMPQKEILRWILAFIKEIRAGQVRKDKHYCNRKNDVILKRIADVARSDIKPFIKKVNEKGLSSDNDYLRLDYCGLDYRHVHYQNIIDYGNPFYIPKKKNRHNGSRASAEDGDDCAQDVPDENENNVGDSGYDVAGNDDNDDVHDDDDRDNSRDFDDVDGDEMSHSDSNGDIQQENSVEGEYGSRGISKQKKKQKKPLKPLKPLNEPLKRTKFLYLILDASNGYYRIDKCKGGYRNVILDKMQRKNAASWSDPKRVADAAMKKRYGTPFPIVQQRSAY